MATKWPTYKQQLVYGCICFKSDKPGVNAFHEQFTVNALRLRDSFQNKLGWKQKETLSIPWRLVLGKTGLRFSGYRQALPRQSWSGEDTPSSLCLFALQNNSRAWKRGGKSNKENSSFPRSRIVGWFRSLLWTNLRCLSSASHVDLG